MAGVSEQSFSDATLMAATGRPQAEWYALLDAEGASAWTHPRIARWLASTHHVDGWWAQGLTVGYEQARGTRLPGQVADGTFTASSSKSLTGSQLEALEKVIAAYTAIAGAAPGSVRPAAKHPTARWKLADGSSVLATVSPGTPEKSRVSLAHLKLSSADQLAGAKKALAGVLEDLA